MSLVDSFKEKCTLLEKKRTPDGEGGWVTVWADGLSFKAAIVADSTLDARVAEKEGMASVYTVTTDKGTPLDFHDVFRREKDGETFRVTSDASDKETPKAASFSFLQVSAEKWKLQ